MINNWTIILFDVRYDNIYQKIFGCISRKKELENIVNLQTVVSNSQKAKETSSTTTTDTKTTESNSNNVIARNNNVIAIIH